MGTFLLFLSLFAACKAYCIWLYLAENLSAAAECGRWDWALHPKKGKRGSTVSFSVVFIRALHLVSIVGVLPVCLIVFKAFIMVCIALSASFLKKSLNL